MVSAALEDNPYFSRTLASSSRVNPTKFLVIGLRCLPWRCRFDFNTGSFAAPATAACAAAVSHADSHRATATRGWTRVSSPAPDTLNALLANRHVRKIMVVTVTTNHWQRCSPPGSTSESLAADSCRCCYFITDLHSRAYLFASLLQTAPRNSPTKQPHSAWHPRAVHPALCILSHFPHPQPTHPPRCPISSFSFRLAFVVQP